jgi:hypothetical protein
MAEAEQDEEHHLVASICPWREELGVYARACRMGLMSHCANRLVVAGLSLCGHGGSDEGT